MDKSKANNDMVNLWSASWDQRATLLPLWTGSRSREAPPASGLCRRFGLPTPLQGNSRSTSGKFVGEPDVDVEDCDPAPTVVKSEVRGYMRDQRRWAPGGCRARRLTTSTGGFPEETPVEEASKRFRLPRRLRRRRPRPPGGGEVSTQRRRWQADEQT